MPKLIFKHIRPDNTTPWVLPQTPYHLNYTGEDKDFLLLGKKAIENTEEPAYPGYLGSTVEEIKDTEVKVIYEFDTVQNRNLARDMYPFHVKCQEAMFNFTGPAMNSIRDYVIMSIID